MAADLNFDQISKEMKAVPNWVLWRYQERKGKLTKVLFQPNGELAGSNNPATWSSFDTVRTSYESAKFAGIEFVFTRESYSGIDPDHCRNPDTGIIDAWAMEYLTRFTSHTEVSPSATGVHIIVKGSIPEGSKELKINLVDDGYLSQAAIELYSEGRYFTVTGNRLEDYPDEPQKRQDILRTVYTELADKHSQKTKKNDNPSAVVCKC